VADYCTLGEVKSRLTITNTDTARDSFISVIISDASLWIETECGRKFSAYTDTRYYTAHDTSMVKVDDLLSITTLKTDNDGDRTYETTWSATDYDLMPLNFTPKQWIEIAPNGFYSFPLTRKGIQIVGSFGFATDTPGTIREAAILKTIQMYKRRIGTGDSSGGNAATGQAQAPSDKAIAELLKPYRKMM
jgi:hypothetical protein